MDNVDVPALSGIEIPGNVGKFGGDLQCLPHRFPEILLSCHRHAALSHFQIQKLVDLRLVFKQYILAHDAQVRCSPLHVDGNVRGLDPEVANHFFRVLKDQLSARVLNGGAFIAAVL